MTRSAFLSSSVAAVALLTSACGFQPLYARGSGVASGLAGIAVETPSTRTGQLVREELEDEFATDRTLPATYRLIVELTERRFPRGLRVDDTANRYEQRVTATYQLVEIATLRVVLRGGGPISVTYDVADAPYAGVVASMDGQERAASEAARVIRTEVARAFAAPDRPLERRAQSR